MVVIENIDSLKAWLVKKLGPICDADPQALAKYVIALLKKDKPENDLQIQCHDQLDVFLQKETKQFVVNLFEALQTKSYLKAATETMTSKTNIKDMSKQGKDVERFHSSSHLPSSRQPRNFNMRRKQDDRRHQRRSPARNNRRRYGKRPRSRTLSPRRQGRSSTSPSSRRNKRSSSPRRSRSPGRRKRSDSCERSSSSRDQSSDSSADKTDDRIDRVKQKARCWDYDQKGFCMKGDLCPFDHGSDALVVDNLTVGSSANQSEETKAAEEKADFKAAPLPPPSSVPPRPLMHGLPLRMPFPPPPVLPPLGVPPPFLARFPLPINVGVPPPSVPPPISTAPSYNPEDPALHTVDSNRRNDFFNPGNFRKRPATGGSAYETGGKRPYYNNNTGSFNRTLIVKKIPPMLNNITQLNEHFSKFGAINNIQVKFDSHPNQALIEFAHVNSARTSIRSTDAVLNNRFIRVFWHGNEEIQQKPTAATEAGATSTTVKDQSVVLPKQDASTEDTTLLSAEKCPALADDASSRPDSNNVKREEEAEDVAAKTIAEKKKAALEASIEAKKKILAAREAMKQICLEKQKLNLQMKAEFDKRRLGLMQKQREEQKLLLAKLEAGKNMPTTEKQDLLKTLKALTSNIDALRNINKNSTHHKMKQEKQMQTRKEPHSTDLESHNASTNTDNTLALKRKLTQLKLEASSLGIVSGCRGGWARGRGRGRGRRRGNSNRFIKSGANLDRRPCQLTVSGFRENEKDEMISHFAGFGEIEKCSFGDGDVTCSIKYKSRHDAEQAVSRGLSFKGRNLVVAWSFLNKPASQTTPASSPAFTTPNHTPALPESPEVKEQKDNEEQDDDASLVEPVSYNPPKDEFGYGILEEELDEEALLTGADIDEDDDDEDGERSWKR